MTPINLVDETATFIGHLQEASNGQRAFSNYAQFRDKGLKLYEKLVVYLSNSNHQDYDETVILAFSLLNELGARANMRVGNLRTKVIQKIEETKHPNGESDLAAFLRNQTPFILRSA